MATLSPTLSVKYPQTRGGGGAGGARLPAGPVGDDESATDLALAGVHGRDPSADSSGANRGPGNSQHRGDVLAVEPIPITPNGSN